MGSRGSDYERRRREEEPWWAQQDADRVAEEQRRLRDEAREQTGKNIDVIKGPRGEYYFVDLDSGDMWPVNQPPSTEQRQEELQIPNPEGDPFSQERKDNAIWTNDKSAVDSVLRPSAGEAWNSFTDNEKGALFDYTGPYYGAINSHLAHGTDTSNKTLNAIDNMTNALNKSELPNDIWLQRGINESVAKSMFGQNYSVEQIQQMVDNGTIVDNKPFMSCGAAKGAGFNYNKPVILHLYAPKGTKGIYAEPFAQCGFGSKLNWDGVKEQKHFGGEFEVIIQRGAQLRPLKVYEASNGVLHVDMQIEGFKID